MGVLINLEGVSAKETECEFIGSVSSLKKILRKGKAATTARDGGALNVWRDDNKILRGSAHVHLKTIEKVQFKNLNEATKWVVKWLKIIDK